MNGILAGSPNSNRSIEVDVTNRFLNNISFTCAGHPNIDISTVPQNILEFTYVNINESELPDCPLSCLVLLRLSNSLEDRFETQMAVDRGDVHNWPMKFLHPSKLKVRMHDSFQSELQSFLYDQ